MPEQDREYRPGSQSKRRTEVECTLPNIVTPVLALKVHEKFVRNNIVPRAYNTIANSRSLTDDWLAATVRHPCSSWSCQPARRDLNPPMLDGHPRPAICSHGFPSSIRRQSVCRGRFERLGARRAF